jgi:polyhydroxyalkanoate synthase
MDIESARRARATARLMTWHDAPSAHADLDVVLTRNKMRLLHYRPEQQKKTRPLLIVYALVNRPYMADLTPKCSLINELREHGLDVYLIDWGDPGPEDASHSLADYLLGDIDACVDKIRERHGIDAVDVLGICQGGTFSLCYATLRPEKIRRLVTSITPVDFQTSDDLLSHLAQRIDAQSLVEAWGNIPGEFLNLIFLSQKPLQLGQQKYADFVKLADDDAASELFLAMEKWIFDSPALAGRAFLEFLKGCYQGNGLVRGTLLIAGTPVRLETLKIPIFNIYARQDHLVPPAASQALRKLVPKAPYAELALDGGHIGLYVSARTRSVLAAAIAEWLEKKLPPGRRKSSTPEGRGEVIRSSGRRSRTSAA